MKMVPPSPGFRGADIETSRGTKRVNVGKDGLINVDSSKTVRQLKAEGFTDANLSSYSAGDSQRGYNCTACGFGSWFKKCGRCGHEGSGIEMDGSNG